MSNPTNPTVMIYNNDQGYWIIHEARDYQKESLDLFLNQDANFLWYENGDIKFTIRTFDSKKQGLEADYSDVSQIMREDETTFLISYNRDKLGRLCGFINRVSCGC